MSIAQTYILHAAEGREADVCDVLERMAAAVRPLPGCESVIVLQDDKTPSRFLFIESFVDAEAHQATVPLMPKEILKELSSLLAGAPDGSTYSFVAQL